MKEKIASSVDATVGTEMATVRRSVGVELDRGETKFTTFRGLADAGEHVALVFGDALTQKSPLVRVHSECLTGDVFQSARCDCGDQLQEAIEAFRHDGGILLYLRQEGRGIGLYAKLDAYSLQDQGFDTFEANNLLGHGNDLREYKVAAQMLQALGARKIRLVTNNPDKVEQLRKLGIEVERMVQTGVFLKPSNEKYLLAKALKSGHHIGLPTIERRAPAGALS